MGAYPHEIWLTAPEIVGLPAGEHRITVELATLRFQRGLSNNLDVVNAQANLLNATSRRLAVLADLAVARLDLRAVLGTLDVRRDVR